jgi:hypothetical protein
MSRLILPRTAQKELLASNSGSFLSISDGWGVSICQSRISMKGMCSNMGFHIQTGVEVAPRIVRWTT